MKFKIQPNINILFNILLALFIVVCSAFFYNSYFQSSLPVYDGVMYEKQQIIRYLAFDGDFSIIQRYSQFIYELIGSPVSGGFTALSTFLLPKCLSNGFNIYLKAFIVLVIFLSCFSHFLSFHVHSTGRYLLLFLLSQIPFFYNYRYGLSSYVPDLTSGLSLCSAFLFTWLYLNGLLRARYFILVPISISIAVFSRYNFFAYSFLIFTPLLWLVLKKINLIGAFWFKFCLYVALSVFVICWISYGFLHFDAFMAYYAKPAEYQHVDYFTSLSSIYEFLSSEVGLVGVVWVLLFIVIFYTFRKVDKELFYTFSITWLVWPFLVLTIFLVGFLKSTLVPHVFSALFIFILPVIVYFALRIPKRLEVKKPKRIYFVLLLFLISSLNFAFQLAKKNEQTQISNINMSLAKYFLQDIQKGDKYFLTHDSMLEIPIDVFIYRKKKIWLQNDLMFYNTDWNFYDIEPSLKPEKILKQYIGRIASENVRYVTVVNKKYSTNQHANKLVTQLRDKLKKYIFNSIKYKKIKIINLSDGGIIYLFKQR